jgi:hypothetical protein
MGVITTLLAATQGRTWVIIRHLHLRFARPNRLPDDLDTFSQLKALKIIWVHFDKRLRPSRYHQQSLQWEYELPVWIGPWAALNVLGFLGAGVILPWFLTEGFLGAPEVRSQQTHNCRDAWSEGYPATLITSDVLLANSIWKQCLGEKPDDSYCGPNFAGMGTYVNSLQSGCIFPSQICLKDQPIATFTRANVTAHDLGVNSKVKIKVSHRISCSPVSLSPFIRRSERPAGAGTDYGNFFGNFSLSIQDPQADNVTDPLLKLQLYIWTNNNPGSGLEMFSRRSGFSLQILPMSSNIPLETPKYIHPLLRIPGAQTFLLVLEAGGTSYPSPIPRLATIQGSLY